MSTDKTLPDLAFDPSANILVRHVGLERQPLLIIDNVLKHPEDMVEYAAAHGDFQTPPETSYYPGLNGVLPTQYGPALVSALRPLLGRHFGIGQKEKLTYEGFYGLSLRSGLSLNALQRIPHFDSPKPFRLAMVHYFCGPPFKGTAFYRHRTTQFETVDRHRIDLYRQTVFAELDQARPVEGQAHTEQAFYDETDTVDARCNRLIVYRSNVLHSGCLNETPLSSDPRSGRLTANSFVEIYRSGTAEAELGKGDF